MFRSWIGLFVLSLFLACSLSKSIKDGRSAYQQKQYYKAIQFLESEIKNYTEGAEYAELSYLLGDSYKNVNDSDNSLKWFIQAAKNNYGAEAFWEMAYALKKKERYEDAILSFQRLLQMTNGRENDIRKEIEKCRIARRWNNVAGDHDYELDALMFNSPQSDYAPYLLDGRYMLFTSDRLSQESEEIYEWTGNAFSDLYIADLSNNNVEPFNNIVNTKANEGAGALNSTKTELYFTRCHSETGDSYCKIMKSELINGQWTNGTPAFNMKPNVNYGDPVLIENDDVLIYTSNDPMGIGSHDLYYSVKEEDGTWSDPDLMPPYLNSIGSERFPRWYDSTLYYSSDFFPGLGGLDIFKTRLNPDGTWTQPENLLAPINSSEDDYSYVIVPDEYLEMNVKKKVYFTSTRGVFGNDDLYSLTEFKSKDELIIVSDTVKEEVAIDIPIDKSFFLEIQVKEKMYAVPTNPNSYIVGLRNVMGASVRFTTPSREDIFITKENGTILVPVDTGLVYDILVGRSGYLNNGQVFRIVEEYHDLEDGQVFTVEIEIERIFEGVEIVLDNIYYDYNESFIREDAKPSLDYLIKILQDNPAIKIQLSSHTDCRGEEDYNNTLSQARANSAIDYINDHGNIRRERLSAVGFGESNPEIDCECDKCSEEEHQINRRTTFSISGQSK